MVFGTLDQALAAARRLHRRHGAVTGILPSTAGRSPRVLFTAPMKSRPAVGSRDAGGDCLVDHDLVLPALTNGEREQYWGEARLFAALFGIRQADLPSDWTSFTAYTEAMWGADTLTVSPAARTIASNPLWPRDRIARAEVVSGPDDSLAARTVAR